MTPTTGLSQGDGHSTLDPEEASLNTVVCGYQVQRGGRDWQVGLGEKRKC